MAIYVGSARIDERGKLSGGSAGDQKQTSSGNDTKGEVSMQPFYVHSKGWYILRPKSIDVANKIANSMITACNNPNLGYDQSNRLGIIKYGVNTKTKTECDCSSTVRACIINATGKDVGNFTTANEVSVLENSGLFEKKISYINQTSTPVFNGDILVTKTKGHTVVVTSGNPRNNSNSNTSSTSTYTKTQFIKDVQSVIGAKVDGIAGKETLSKTVTVSKSKNNKHAVIKPIQKYLNSLGYNCGVADGVAGSKFDAAVKAYQKANGCVADGEITAQKSTWKKLLGM